MKKSIRLLGMMLTITAASLFVGCSDDDGPSIDDIIDPGTQLADGFYIVGSAVSSDTTEANLLVQGEVNAPDFAKQSRTGFFEAYVFMGTGDFAFIKVAGEEVTSFASATTEAEDGDPEPIDIHVGSLTESTTAASSPVDGQLVHVMVDEQTSEFVIIPVDYWEIIGAATEGGWSSGQKLEQKGTASADAVTFEGTDIVLRGPDQYKIRFNSNWSMNLEDECDAAAEACLNYFTNFGGTTSALVHGDSNLEFDGDDGKYTVTVSYTPGSGNSITLSLERTGDVDAITFDPEDFKWGVIGNGTAGGWGSDRDLFYKGNDDTKGHWWAGVVYLVPDSAFKFRANDAWDVNLGGSLGLDVVATLEKGGGDFATPETEGAYYIELSTTDEGDTWTATMTASGWGVIGDGSPQGNWDADIDMTANGFVDGVTTYSIQADFTTAAWKFRANDDWAINMGIPDGGDLTALSLDGGNIELDAAGTLTVTLSIAVDADGKTVYSATAE